MGTRLFDAVRFEEGDIVRAKNPDNRVNPFEEIVKEELIENLDGFSYSIIFFKSNDKEFHVAFEYEPYDSKERKQYYEIWKDAKVTKKAKKKKAVKKSTKVLKL